MKDLLHVASGGGGRLVRTYAILTRTQVRRIPIPPVMLGVRLLVLTVVILRFAKEFCTRSEVRRPSSC